MSTDTTPHEAALDIVHPDEDGASPLPDWYVQLSPTRARVALQGGSNSGAFALLEAYTRKVQRFVDRKMGGDHGEFRDAVVLHAIVDLSYPGIEWPPAPGLPWEKRRALFDSMSARDFDRLWLAANKLCGAGGDDPKGA